MSQTPDLMKYDSSSFVNEDRTDVNDYDSNSVAYTQPTVLATPQLNYSQPAMSRLIQQQQQQQAQTNQPAQRQLHNQIGLTSQQSARPVSTVILTKDVLNAESPGSTISDAPNIVPPQSVEQQQGQQQSKLSQEEQSLIAKLQDTYKVIIRLENTLQQRCSTLNVPQKLDMMNELWDVYNINIQLLNSYYDFLLYSMGSGKSGKQIVQVYRIPRRLWVYGVVTFLDVIKNVVSIFIEHDICSSFIGYAFNILSGLTELEMDGWMYEKLGDLSRMAIALYPSRYIDWKISSEYWYTQAMKNQYGYGKIYYHIATVQQDSLDALVNIGKSVFCRDTFVPTPQYMRMVIDNINQRSYIDLPVLDFTKVYKLLLTGEINDMFELNKLITYYTQNLGVDNNNVDFFKRVPGTISEVITSPNYSPDNDFEGKFQFWLQRSSSFALANISLMVGFGVPMNPFARLFGLLEALKERKEKKEKKEKSKSTNGDATNGGVLPHIEATEPVQNDNIKELSIQEWFSTHGALDKVVVKLTMKMFDTYLRGPIIAAMPHVITFLYFIVAVGEATKSKPNSRLFFETIINMLLPTNSLINYLNDVLTFVRSKPEYLSILAQHQARDPEFLKGGFLKYYSDNETLIEVWRCWGTLWFDVISLKEEYNSPRESGISKGDLLDVPIGGARYDPKMNPDRFIRIVLLATYISDNFNFGIKRGSNYIFYNSVDTIMERDSFSPEENAYLKSTYMELAQQAKALGLIENPFTDNAGVKSTRMDPLSWIQGSGDKNTLHNSSIIDYTDDADNENSEDELEHSEFGDEVELDALNHDTLGDTSSLRPSPSFYTVDSGVLMSKSTTFFILDTNMWLKHCGKLYKSLRSGIFKLAVPLVVFQELRSLRCSPDATVSDSATRAVITLRQLATDGLVVPLKMDGTESHSLNDVSDFENNSMWAHKIDQTIIQSAKLMANRLQSSVVGSTPDGNSICLTIVVSEDRGMRLQARVENVPAFQGKWFFQVVQKLSEGKCCD